MIKETGRANKLVLATEVMGTSIADASLFANLANKRSQEHVARNRLVESQSALFSGYTTGTIAFLGYLHLRNLTFQSKSCLSKLKMRSLYLCLSSVNLCELIRQQSD